MGRVSVPVLNKSGYSMYWNSVWDDKINYTRSLKDDIFLREFVYLFFEGGSYSTIFFNLKNFKKKFNFLKKKYFFHTKKIFKKNDFASTYRNKFIIKRKKKFRPYLTKVWILKYQTWVIIFFYSYTFNLSVFFKKLESFNKKNYKYSNIMYKYYNSIFKIKYNYNVFKKSLSYKIF